MAECSIATSQKDYLHPFGSLAQDFDHQIKPSIIRINERIIEDERNRPTLFQKHICERDPRQHRELLLSAT